MKAVLLEVTEFDLARRRRLGLDRFDEMWEGVLHMVPAPDYEHQRIKSKLLIFLDGLLTSTQRGLPALEVNVFNDASPSLDYRIPDISILVTGQEKFLARDGIHGGPAAVIEIRSPGDETFEKFPFYESLGVREVLVVDRDSKKPEVHRLTDGRLVRVPEDRNGWTTSEAIGVRLRATGTPPQLEVSDTAKTGAHAVI